jgi:hypothetical protein
MIIEFYADLKSISFWANAFPLASATYGDPRQSLPETYLKWGIIGPGSRADALHVALATTGGTDVLVSWNFKHILNLGRIRHFQAVNLELGYPAIEIGPQKRC